MKKIVISIIICCSIFILAQAKNKKNKKKHTYVSEATYIDSSLKDAQIGAKLIKFAAITSKEESFTNQQIPEKNSVLLMLFNPSCGHCEDATILLNKDSAKFKNTTILLMAANMMHDNLTQFIKETGLKENSPIIVTTETGNTLEKLFMKKGIPQVMVYNKNKILQTIFYSEINTDSLVYYLNKK